MARFWVDPQNNRLTTTEDDAPEPVGMAEVCAECHANLVLKSEIDAANNAHHERVMAQRAATTTSA